MSKVQKSEKHRRLVRGVRKHWMNVTDFKVAGVPCTPTEVIDGLQSLVEQHDRTARAYAAWRDEVRRERLLEKQIGPIVRSVQHRVRSQFDRDAKKLADFGMRYVKPGPKKLESKRQMLAKRKKRKAGAA
ncbi:MAG TPA: hypothetical protein VF765_04865 [Polyangiaceae bacterium]